MNHQISISVFILKPYRWLAYTFKLTTPGNQSLLFSLQYNTELHEHQGACKKNDNELKQAKDTCQSLNKEISSIQSDLFKLKQQNEADKPVDIGALEDDEERFQVISIGY